MSGFKKDIDIIGQKLHTPLMASDPKIASRFLQGGYNQPGYGVPTGAAIDGSFAIGSEGSQGYYVDGGKRIFLSIVSDMKSFFARRAKILGKEIRCVIKPGIGGQHTPFQAIADLFNIISAGKVKIVGEYELGKEYEMSLSMMLKELNADWDQIAIIPSSKSGSTDETMVIFTEIFYIMLKKIAAKEGIDGSVFADTVLNAMHRVNFIDGKERPGKDLFKGFTLSLINDDMRSAGHDITYDQIKKIFGVVLGNMFFETTDRPEQSRLSAFIRNSGLDKELGDNGPGFGAMFDNVGGRWTADIHMMTFLAYYKLDAEKYWNKRYEGIVKVRNGSHRATKIADKILEEGIKDIALVVPDELFWFGKAMEQNFNESIWQRGFANLIAVKISLWEAQRIHYSDKSSSLVIDTSSKDISDASLKIVKLEGLKFPLCSKEELIELLAELFTTFYGLTHTIGNRLISRALNAKHFTEKDADLNDLDNPATKIVQQNLYLRQPYVELGKGLLEKRLKSLQEGGAQAIEKELERIKSAATAGDVEIVHGKINTKEKANDAKKLADIISRAAKYAMDSNRKFVPFIYLEGEKFIDARDRLIKSGVEWVMQGTGDQHISYQQVLAQPERYMPFIISFVPKEALPGHPAVGFAKGYLHNVSPNMVRDLFAEASYKALVEPRKNEAQEEVRGAAGIFLRLIDSDSNRSMFIKLFENFKNIPNSK